MFNHKMSELTMQNQDPAHTPSSPGAKAKSIIKNEDMGEHHEKNGDMAPNGAPTINALVVTNTSDTSDPDTAAIERNGSSLNGTTSPTVESSATPLPAAINIATLHPHRTGSSLLPLLPVLTSTYQIPQRFGPSSTHLASMSSLLAPLAIPLHAPPAVLHRYHASQSQSLGKSTLTLAIKSDSPARDTWAEALHAAEAYLAKHNLTLCVEITHVGVF
jgi:hypothetical protein